MVPTDFATLIFFLSGVKAEAEMWRARLRRDDLIIGKTVRKFNLLAKAKVDSGMLLEEAAVTAGVLPWDSAEGAMPRIVTQRRVVIESLLSWRRNLEELKILRREAAALRDHLRKREEELTRLICYCDFVSPAAGPEMAREFNPATQLDLNVASSAAATSASSVPIAEHSRYRLHVGGVEGADPAKPSVVRGFRALCCAERTDIWLRLGVVLFTLDSMQESVAPKKIGDPF